MENSHAFTTRFPGRSSILFNKIELSKSTFKGDAVEMLPTLAIWDTGANGSCITPTVVKALGLRSFQKAYVHTAAGEAIQDVYEVCIHLPNGVSVNVQVTEVPYLSKDFEALIGMNIIGLGDFAVSNFEGKTQMTFRMPSIAHADYA